jgi:hypothetical protein
MLQEIYTDRSYSVFHQGGKSSDMKHQENWRPVSGRVSVSCRLQNRMATADAPNTTLVREHLIIYPEFRNYLPK